MINQKIKKRKRLHNFSKFFQANDMKKLAILFLSIFTLSVATLFGCSGNKTTSLRPIDEFTANMQIAENSEKPDTDSERPDCPDRENDKPIPRKSCKRNRKRPPRRNTIPENTNKKSPN